MRLARFGLQRGALGPVAADTLPLRVDVQLLVIIQRCCSSLFEPNFFETEPPLGRSQFGTAPFKNGAI